MGQIVGYCRLSTKEQGEIGITLEQQQCRLKEAGAQEIYTDLISGKRDDRPQFLQVLDLANKGLISKIICVRVDRYGRDGFTIITSVMGLHRKGVQFQFLDDPDVDLDTDVGMFMLFVKAGLAQRESHQLSQRVKNGLNYRKQRNQPISGVAFGYVINEDKTGFILDKKLWINGKSKADIAREIIESFLELKSGKASIERINKKYGMQVMSVTGVNRWIRLLVLRGHTVYNTIDSKTRKKIPKDQWDIRYDTHPNETLLSPEEAEMIDLITESKYNFRYKVKSFEIEEPRHYFTRLIKCAECGTQLTTRLSACKKKHRYFFCRNTLCLNKGSIREDRLNHAVILKILDRVHNFVLNEEENLIKPVYKSPHLEKLESELEEIECALSLNPNNKFLIAAKNECIDKIKEEDIFNIKDENICNKSALEIINHPAIKSIGFLENLSCYDRRLIYYKLINVILVSNKSVNQIILNV